MLQVLAIEFVTFAIEFVTLAIEFVPLAIEFVTLAIELIALAIDFIALAQKSSITRLAAAANMKTRCSSCNKSLFRYNCSKQLFIRQ